MKKLSVMILDGNTRQTLAMVRSFGKRGIKVYVGSHSHMSRSFFSRYCAESFVYPSNDLEGSATECILSNIRKFNPDVLMPVLDRTYVLVMQNRRIFEQYTCLIPLPEYSQFVEMQDKYRLTTRAMKLNIPVPETYFLQDISDIQLTSQKMKYPAIIKPRISAGGVGMRLVRNAFELCDVYKMYVATTKTYSNFANIMFDNHNPLIQEYIQGKIYNFYAYCEHSQVKTFFMTQTLRNYPLPFGPGIAARSINQNTVKQLSFKLISSIQFTGIIDIQYIFDKSDNTFKLIDANPRGWGTIENAIAHGIEFPHILFQRAVKQEVAFPQHYREGREFRWILFGEILYFLKARNKLALLREYLAAKNVLQEIAVGDLMPHVIQALSLVPV